MTNPDKRPNIFISSLARSLMAGGSDTEIYLSTIQTYDGQTISTADFSFFGHGRITIDVLSLPQIEVAQFTGVAGTTGIDARVTGCTRGLSSKDTTSISANKKFHPVGTPVIISFYTQDLTDIETIINDNYTALYNLIQAAVIQGALPASTTQMGISRISVSPNVTLGTATITIASPAVITKASHGLTVNDLVQFTTTGTLPTGITAGVDYYVLSAGLTANDFEISATPGGAAINTSGTQSGVHTLIKTTPIAVGNNDTRLLTADQAAALVGTSGSPPNAINTYVDKAFLTDGNTTDQSQTVQDTSTPFGEADATTKQNLVAQSFVSGKSPIVAVDLWKFADTGAFTGDVTIELRSDNTGSPSNTVLATVTILNAAYLALGAGANTFTFSSQYVSTLGVKYWIVASSTTADNANHPNLGANSAGGYANGEVKYFDTADGWTLVPTIDLYFKVLSTNADKIIVTDSSGNLDPNIKVDASTGIIGVLPVANGGTGSTTLPFSGMFKNGTDTFVVAGPQTITVTHNLGVIPKRILTGVAIASNDMGSGYYDSSGQRSQSFRAGISGGNAFVVGNNGGNFYSGLIQNVTTTTFEIVWSTGAWASGNFSFNWAVEA